MLEAERSSSSQLVYKHMTGITGVVPLVFSVLALYCFFVGCEFDVFPACCDLPLHCIASPGVAVVSGQSRPLLGTTRRAN